MILINIIPPIKFQTPFKAGQILPFLKKIAYRDDLKIILDKDMKFAWNKFRYMLIISGQYMTKDKEHQPLQYWVNADFNKAEQIFKNSIRYN